MSVGVGLGPSVGVNVGVGMGVLVDVAVGVPVAVGVSVLMGGGGRVLVGEGRLVGVSVIWAMAWVVLVGWVSEVAPGVAQPWRRMRRMRKSVPE